MPTTADGLDQWRVEQARLAEVQELQELKRRLATKKQHTQRWVQDQHRWDGIRPVHEFQYSSCTGQSPMYRNSTPQPPSTHFTRPVTPPQRAWTPVFGERPTSSRRATDTITGYYAMDRPKTPSNGSYKVKLQRNMTMTASMCVPEEASCAYTVSPKIEQVRVEAENWMADWRRRDHELRARAEGEAARTQALQDSVNSTMRRMDSVLGRTASHRTDDERERRKSTVTQDERRKLSQEQRMARAWATYEARWAALQENAPQSLSFHDIPWPMATAPRSPADLTASAVQTFLFSPVHSAGKSTRDRARHALRTRWHPDKFQKWLPLLGPDRALVVEEVNKIAKHLAVLALSQS